MFSSVGICSSDENTKDALQESTKDRFLHKVTFTFGFGAAYDLTDNVQLHATWQRFNKRDKIDSAYYLSAGISYYFG